MTCPHCGQELSAGAPFCGVCGANATETHPKTIPETNPAIPPEPLLTTVPSNTPESISETNSESESRPAPAKAENNHLSPTHADSAPRDLPDNSSNHSPDAEPDEQAIARDEIMAREAKPPPKREQASLDRAEQFIKQTTYEAAVNALVGKKAAAYQKRFQNNSIFNIWGFIFGPSWYAYRRMIGKAFLSSIICIIPIFGLIAFFYYAFTGDWHYRQRIDKHAQKLAQFQMGSQEWNKYVDKHGGTSVLMIIFYWFGCAVLTCLLNMLLKVL